MVLLGGGHGPVALVLAQIRPGRDADSAQRRIKPRRLESGGDLLRDEINELFHDLFLPFCVF